MCVGVTIGLAGFRFSVSGLKKSISVNINVNTSSAGHISFTLKYGQNGR